LNGPVTLLKSGAWILAAFFGVHDI
jgi:hypothetical protein